MRIGAVTRKANSVYLGIARVLCDKSSSYLTTTGLALDYDDDSLGVLGECTVNFAYEYLDVPVLGAFEPTVKKIKDDISISASFQEMTARNLAIGLGLDASLFEDDFDKDTANTKTVTFNSTTSVVECATHGYTAGQKVKFSTTGSLPASLTAGTTYWVLASNLLVGSFEISSTKNGTKITFATSGSGTHTCTISDILDEIYLGNNADPIEVRVEVICVYPDQQNYMAIILPKAIVRVAGGFNTSNSDSSSFQVTFEGRRADVKHGGVSQWDSSPLGKIIFSTFNL